eukprot:6384912-Alexandrium_andersonii.AAC.1
MAACHTSASRCFDFRASRAATSGHGATSSSFAITSLATAQAGQNRDNGKEKTLRALSPFTA